MNTIGKIHELKTANAMFDALTFGGKTFEVRRNDRDFQPNDLLCLRELTKVGDGFTGRSALYQVGFVLYGPRYGVEEGYCVMAIKRVL